MKLEPGFRDGCIAGPSQHGSSFLNVSARTIHAGKLSPGCGFPIMGALVLFSLAVGTAIDAAVSPYSGKQTGENSLLRTLHGTLNEGDVLVLNRYFSGWFDIALLQQRGVNVVVRKHQLRIARRIRVTFSARRNSSIWAGVCRRRWCSKRSL